MVAYVRSESKLGIEICNTRTNKLSLIAESYKAKQIYYFTEAQRVLFTL